MQSNEGVNNNCDCLLKGYFLQNEGINPLQLKLEYYTCSSLVSKACCNNLQKYVIL